MIPSLADARTELAGLIDVSLDGIDAVYDHEPTGEVDGPVYVTVTLSRVTPTQIIEAVRIYSQMADSPTEAAERLEAAIEAVDDLLKAEQFGPSDWDTGVNEEVMCHVARCFVEIGRETY